MGESPRYKLIFQALVGENNNQALRVASRCLWDKDLDHCATATFSNVRAPRFRARASRRFPHLTRAAPLGRVACTPPRCALLSSTSDVPHMTRGGFSGPGPRRQCSGQKGAFG